mgnify:CR=1 FL=1
MDSFAAIYTPKDTKAPQFLFDHAADTRALQLRWTDRQFLGRDWRLESVLRADRVSLLAQGELKR